MSSYLVFLDGCSHTAETEAKFHQTQRLGIQCDQHVSRGRAEQEEDRFRNLIYKKKISTCRAFEKNREEVLLHEKLLFQKKARLQKRQLLEIKELCDVEEQERQLLHFFENRQYRAVGYDMKSSRTTIIRNRKRLQAAEMTNNPSEPMEDFRSTISTRLDEISSSLGGYYDGKFELLCREMILNEATSPKMKPLYGVEDHFYLSNTTHYRSGSGRGNRKRGKTHQQVGVKQRRPKEKRQILASCVGDSMKMICTTTGEDELPVSERSFQNTSSSEKPLPTSSYFQLLQQCDTSTTFIEVKETERSMRRNVVGQQEMELNEIINWCNSNIDQRHTRFSTVTCCDTYSPQSPQTLLRSSSGVATISHPSTDFTAVQLLQRVGRAFRARIEICGFAAIVVRTQAALYSGSKRFEKLLERERRELNAIDTHHLNSNNVREKCESIDVMRCRALQLLVEAAHAIGVPHPSLVCFDDVSSGGHLTTSYAQQFLRSISSSDSLITITSPVSVLHRMPSSFLLLYNSSVCSLSGLELLYHTAVSGGMSAETLRRRNLKSLGDILERLFQDGDAQPQLFEKTEILKRHEALLRGRGATELSILQLQMLRLFGIGRDARNAARRDVYFVLILFASKVRKKNRKRVQCSLLCRENLKIVIQKYFMKLLLFAGISQHRRHLDRAAIRLRNRNFDKLRRKFLTLLILFLQLKQRETNYNFSSGKYEVQLLNWVTCRKGVNNATRCGAGRGLPILSQFSEFSATQKIKPVGTRKQSTSPIAGVGMNARNFRMMRIEASEQQRSEFKKAMRKWEGEQKRQKQNIEIENHRNSEMFKLRCRQEREILKRNAANKKHDMRRQRRVAMRRLQSEREKELTTTLRIAADKQAFKEELLRCTQTPTCNTLGLQLTLPPVF